MNKQVSAFFLATPLFLVLACSVVLAQDVTPPAAGTPQPSDGTIPPPQAPFVRKPAEYSHWTIKFDRPKTAPVRNNGEAELGESPGTVMSHDKPVKIDSIEYVKTADIGVASMTLVDGMRLLRWSVDDLVLTTYPGRKDVYIDRNSGLVPQEGRFMAEYPYFTWMDSKYYAGVAEVSGVKCYVFHQDGASHPPPKPDPKDPATIMGTPENMAMSHGARDAWVTVEGRWPLAYRDDGGMHRFTHLQPPPTGQKLPLPPEFQAQLDIYLGRK